MCFVLFVSTTLHLKKPIFTGKIEPNVSTDAIKGAALAGAALPIIAGAKGAGISLAAFSGLMSSYLAVTQGYGGDAARVIGELAWKSTGALKSVASTSKALISGASDVVKDMNRERMLDAVAKGDVQAASKMDKEVQRVLAEAEEAVAEAEKAAGKVAEKAPSTKGDDDIAALEEETRQAEEAARIAEEEAAKAAELARLEDEALLAKEFEKARMEEMRAEAAARAQQERIEEDQRRAEEEAARLAEEDRLAAVAAEEAALEEQANQLLAAEEARLAAEEAMRQTEEEELQRIAAAEEAALIAAEAEALMAEAEKEANDATEESEKLHSLQDAAEDADIAAQARAAVEAMEAQAAAEGYPDFDEDDESFLSDEDLEASIAMAQELDGDIAGVDDLLSALRELDADGELDQTTPDFDEDDESFLDEKDKSPQDLAKAAREAVEMYEADMAAKRQETEKRKSEWAAEAEAAVEVVQEDAAVATETKPTTDWSKLTVAKLKDELRSRGLKASGKKAELIQALTMYESEMNVKSQEEEHENAEWVAEAMEAVAETDTAVATETTSKMDRSKLTVAMLKDELRSRGLKVSGTKAVLIQRLEEDDMYR